MHRLVPWAQHLLLVLALVCVDAAVARASAPPPTTAPTTGVPSADEAPLVNELSLGWAPRVFLRQDQIASPRLYHGPGWVAAVLRYQRSKGANAHRLEVDFAKAMIRSQPDFEYFNWPEGEAARTSGTPQTQIRLKYAYLRALPMPERFALRLGPALDFDIQQLDWVYHPFALGVYFGAFALDARAEFEFRPSSRHRLRASASLPIFGWVARSPYGINDEEQVWANRDHNGAKTFFRYLANGQLQSWNRLQAVRLDLNYDLGLAEHWALSFGVHARIVANQVPQPLLAQEYGGSLAVTARF